MSGTFTGLTIDVGDNLGLSGGARVSGDGRYVMFTSPENGIVPDDTNNFSDVFMWDRDTSTLQRITSANGNSEGLSISEDGRYVLLSSAGTNVVLGDYSGQGGMFRWDRETGEAIRIADPYGIGSMSADGHLVVFESATDGVAGDTSDTNGKSDVFLWNADSGTITRITDSDNHSHDPMISADGGTVTFWAYTSHDVPDDTNQEWDVFVWDVATETTTRVTDGNGDSVDPTISGDGRYVAFYSEATNLVAGSGLSGMFVWDRQTGLASRIPISGSYPVISADGSQVVFIKPGGQGLDVHVWDATTGATTNITQGNHDSGGVSQSTDGSVIAFWSEASDLVPELPPADVGWTDDVFVWQRDR
jgi:Tol biopolymer transport system component